MSVLDDQPVIEASLGGRIDLLEMHIFTEDLEEMFDQWNDEPFYLLLDYSKAITFDQETMQALNGLKETALKKGAVKVFSVPHEDVDLEEAVTGRMQRVLEGKEEFLAAPQQARFAPLRTQKIARAA